MAKTKTKGEPPAVARYREILAELEEGVTLAALAKRHGVKRKTLVWWRWEVARRDELAAKAAKPGKTKRRSPAKERAPKSVAAPPPPLLPVVLGAPEPALPATEAQAGRAGFEVALPSGVEVRVPAGFDAADLRRLLAVLGAPGC